MSAPSIPVHEYSERRQRATAIARERGLAGLVIWSRNGTTVDWYGDVLYLANHHSPFPQQQDNPPLWTGRGHSVLILPVDGEPVLAIDDYDYREDLVAVDDVRVDLNLPALVGSVLTELGLADAPLGLAGRESLLLRSFELLTESLGHKPDFRPADDVVAGLRMIKSEAELEMMRAAAAVGAECMNAMLEAAVEGNTEGHVAGAGWRKAAESGAFFYDTAIVSGPQSDRFQWARLPSWDHTRPLVDGDLLHVDMYGPAASGYCTDFVRSTVVGNKPETAQRDLLDSSIAHVEAMIEAIRPGVTFGQVHEVGEAWRETNGFSAGSLDANFPAFGHCIGLSGLEHPYITAGNEAVVEENMVIAVETLLAIPGLGGSGFEQDLVVGADGTEVLSAVCPERRW